MKDAKTAPLVVLALVAVITAVVLEVRRDGVFFLVAVPALIVEFWAVAQHDKRHRAAGEPTHAMWGQNDRNKPSWWPSRR